MFIEVISIIKNCHCEVGDKVPCCTCCQGPISDSQQFTSPGIVAADTGYFQAGTAFSAFLLLQSQVQSHAPSQWSLPTGWVLCAPTYLCAVPSTWLTPLHWPRIIFLLHEHIIALFHKTNISAIPHPPPQPHCYCCFSPVSVL